MKFIIKKTILAHPFTRRVYWVVYAVLLYTAGLNFTTWVMEPESFTGTWEWLWLALFPPLFVGFFFINHRLGCTAEECSIAEQGDKSEARSIGYSGRMPGI